MTVCWLNCTSEERHGRTYMLLFQCGVCYRVRSVMTAVGIAFLAKTGTYNLHYCRRHKYTINALLCTHSIFLYSRQWHATHQQYAQNALLCSQRKMVTRTHHSVTLYVQYIACLVERSVGVTQNNHIAVAFVQFATEQQNNRGPQFGSRRSHTDSYSVGIVARAWSWPFHLVPLSWLQRYVLTSMLWHRIVW